MGLGGWLRKKGIGIAIGPYVEKISAAIAWLNAEPGRKRSIALVCIGCAAMLRAAGKESYAVGIEGLNGILQGLSTTTDIAGAIMGIWGVVHPFIATYQTKQAQAINVLEKAAKAIPPEEHMAKGLTIAALANVQEAKAITEQK